MDGWMQNIDGIEKEDRKKKKEKEIGFSFGCGKHYETRIVDADDVVTTTSIY